MLSISSKGQEDDAILGLMIHINKWIGNRYSTILGQPYRPILVADDYETNSGNDIVFVLGQSSAPLPDSEVSNAVLGQPF